LAEPIDHTLGWNASNSAMAQNEWSTESRTVTPPGSDPALVFRFFHFAPLFQLASHTPLSSTLLLPQFSTVCFAKHVNDKAAKWAASKRPKKSRPSDINRKPIVYELHSMPKPAEYTIGGN